MSVLELISPIYKHVKRIKESLFNREVHSAETEEFIYGTFELSFRDFEKERNRKGDVKVSVKDFYLAMIAELDTIQKDVIRIEKESDTSFEVALNLIKECQSLAREKISNLNPAKSQKETRPLRLKTYQWQGKTEEIVELYNEMKGRFIDNHTTSQDFANLFSEVYVSDLKNPVKWLSGNASELLFFIKELMSRDIIAGKDTNMNYKRLIACFVKPTGESFTENFKSINQNVEIALNSNSQLSIRQLTEKFS